MARDSRGAAQVPDGPIFGRRAQQQFIEDAAARLSAQQGTTMLWTGAGGVGKSSLLDYGRRIGERANLPVISGKCTLAESGRVFGPLGDQWPQLHEDVPVEDANMRELRPAARVSEIDRFLALLEESAPCVVLVDDLQWADDATLYGLLAAFARRDDLPVCTLLARRPEPTSPALLELASALASASAEEVLRPLDEAAVGQFVSHLLGAAPTPKLRKVLDRAGGNPFYVRELLGSLDATGLIVDRGSERDVVGAATPQGVLETVAARIGRLPTEVVGVLEIASTFGATFDARALAAVAELGVAELIRALDVAQREQLIVESDDQFAFAHDLIREGAYHRLSASAASQLHISVAQFLLDVGADPGAVAHQIYESGQHTVEAGRLLESGATTVLASNPELSHRYLLRAIECPIEDTSRRSQLIASSARALFWSGESGAAERYLDDQLADADPELAISLATLRAEIMFIQGRLKESAVEMEALARNPDTPDPGLRWADAGICYLLEGDLDRAEPLLRKGVEVSRKDNHPRGLTEALTGLTWVTTLRGDPVAGVALGEEAVAVADADGEGDGHRAMPYVFLGQALNWADRSEEAVEAFRRGQQIARDLRVGYHEPLYNTAASGEYARHGDWDRAVARAESVFAYSADTASGLGDTWAYATLIEVVRRRGEIERAEELVDRACSLVDGGAGEGIDLVLWQQALLQHHRQEYAAAHDGLFLVWTYLVDRNVWVRAREMAADVAHLALDAGRFDEAALVASTMEAAVEKTNHQMYAATAHRCRAIVDADAGEMARAIELIKDAPRPVEVAGYYEDGAVILLKSGRAGEARPWAQEALDRYQAFGAKFDEQRLRRRTAEFGFSLHEDQAERPVSGWASLTETESYVADLVAMGQTSSAIAEAMGVSRRTVESHLSRIYPKLNVANRVELVVASASR